MPLIATRGAASAQGFGEFAQTAAPVYIEDVFSTYLYTGNGSTQTITNGIDLSGKGGFVWTKNRDTGGTNHILCDTARGITNYINSNNTNGQNANGVLTDVLTGTTTSGYTLGADATLQAVNVSTKTYVSWTFRKQPKFFDVVTYTGNGSSTNNVSHNLGSLPGFIVVKRTDTSGNWCVAAGDSSGNYLQLSLNSTSQSFASAAKSAIATTTTFNAGYIGTNFDGSANVNGGTYVAYLFAHNAGGFGLTGSDNVITCGSYTGNGGTLTVNLGYEPQWILVKRSDSTSNWAMIDVMRGWVVGASSQQQLFANTSGAETGDTFFGPTATGFSANLGGTWNTNGGTYIYIAIRRGPMKTPTTGTSVFTPVSTSGNVSEITAGFPVDFALGKEVKNSTSYGNYAIDRLRGGTVLLETNTTGAEFTSQTFKFDSNTKFLQSGGGLFYGPSIYWLMRRAPGFFDVVCYTGTGANLTVAHNLTVVPELIIAKNRTTAGNNWPATFNFTSTNSSYAFVNLTSAGGNDTYANVGVMTAQPTSTNLFLSPSGSMNTSGNGHVAYLFATVAGVSKVGSYTGTGALQTVNCGFTTGARFVLIKRTDSTGDWWVYDSARGISSGNDPYLFLNSTAAEVTNTNYVDTTSVGFQVTAAAPAGLNANGGSYIFLAVA